MDDAGDGGLIAQAITARLPSGAVVKVEAMGPEPGTSRDGMTSVGQKDRHLNLGDALDSVGEIGELLWRQVGKAMPSKATVELKLGFAVESGKLTALWVSGKGEAALTVTLEWAGRPDGTSDASENASHGTDEQG